MSWQENKTFQLTAATLDVSFNTEHQNALGAVSLPENIATANALAESAKTDAERRSVLTEYANQLEYLVIDPWQRGTSAQSKQSAVFYLSPTEANEILVAALDQRGWKQAVLFMLTGATPLVLAQSIENLLAVFPVGPLQKCWRHANTLATHESDKLFIKAGSELFAQTQLEQFSAFNGVTLARQNIATAEAIASDTDPAAILADFKTRRSAALQTLADDIGALEGGQISYVLSLTGEDLSNELEAISPPDVNAPMCVLFAVGGTADAVAPLQEALSL